MIINTEIYYGTAKDEKGEYKQYIRCYASLTKNGYLYIEPKDVDLDEYGRVMECLETEQFYYIFKGRVKKQLIEHLQTGLYDGRKTDSHYWTNNELETIFRTITIN